MFSWKKVKVLLRGNGLTNKQRDFVERNKSTKKQLLVLPRGRGLANK
jgi:hypothetical protein